MSIRINVSNQKGFLWDIKDIQTLRVEHHICGILTGTLPQVGQQNIFLGLPLMLLPEEVVLLVKNKIAYLVDDISAHHEPTPEQAADYHKARNSSILKQQTESIKNEESKRLAMSELYKDQIEKAKQAKQLKKAGRTAVIDLDGEEEIIPIASTSTSAPTPTSTSAPSPLDSFEILITSTPTASSPSTSLPSPIARDPSSVPYTIQIHPSSTQAPWYSPSSHSYTTLKEAREVGLWNYPDNKVQLSRCKIFEDLWKRGHFMGGGLRFGGDFLVYPGDPLRFHSHFTLTVLSSSQSSIMPMDIVAYGRLATGVKKAHLLASWIDDDELIEGQEEVERKGRAEYFSLEWSAFG